MQAVILAGGLGTRLSEETVMRPKPMVEVGGKPLLWHVMSIYASHGISDFVICAGYRGVMIKRYFAEYFTHNSDATFDLSTNQVEYHAHHCEPWRVTVVDTGLHTMTGGRLKRIERYLSGDTFCMTYGDGVADVDVGAVIEHHKQSSRLATLTAVQPPGRFGALRFGAEDSNQVASFEEKPEGDGSWINGGFFVLNRDVLDLIDGDSTIWEQHPLADLASRKQLNAYRHQGFWQPMDTLRDRNELERLWNTGSAPWLPNLKNQTAPQENPRLRLVA